MTISDGSDPASDAARMRSSDAAELALVIACYNEARRLDVAALERVADARTDLRFVLVDDGSTDGTGAILSRIAAQRPRSFSAMSLPHNMGKAEAVRRGTLAALDSGSGFVGFWDADFSTPLEEIDRFLAVFRRDAAVVAVLGSRIQRLGADIRRSALRHYLGRIFATAASLILELPAYDTQCGAKMFRSCPQVRAAFASPFLSSWVFDVELIARLRAQMEASGAADAAQAFFELPLAVWRDVEGSKLKLSHMAMVPMDLLKIRRLYRRPKRPLP